MEEKEGINGSGVTVRGDEGPQSYMVEPRVKDPDSFHGSAAAAADLKKKRGRPRKYGSDGSSLTLSPMPISASIPLTGEYSGWKQSGGRPINSFKKKSKLDFGNAGGPTSMSYPASGRLTPHMITVNSGEDIMMKIISFSQQGSRAICILAANGTVSNVALRQPSSSGGTLTYEGCFEILALAGSFIPSDNGVTKSRSGGMSVSLAGPDGRVLGGGLAGMLVAAGPVQIVIGSFVPGGDNQPEQKQFKKLKHEQTIAFGAIPTDPVLEPPSKPNGDNVVVGEDSGEQSHALTTFCWE